MPRGSSGRYVSPLRYPGGKGKVANFFKLLFLHNDLVGCEYAEPYAGGAGVALSLLYEEYAGHIHINDLNRSVFTFWKCALEQTDGLCARIQETSVTMEQWHLQRDIQKASDPDPLDLAFSTFFLNRTNRSGIIDGGVIGGLDQSGAWKLDARFTKVELIRRIQKIGRHRSRISLTQLDAAAFLRDRMSHLPEESLVYLDPPYYVKGEGLYQNFYTHEDHVQIARLVRGLTQPWVVSYDAAPEVLRLYGAGFASTRYSLSYSANARYSGREVMFFSPDLEHPEAISPAGIRMEQVRESRAAIL